MFWIVEENAEWWNVRLFFSYPLKDPKWKWNCIKSPSKNKSHGWKGYILSTEALFWWSVSQKILYITRRYLITSADVCALSNKWDGVWIMPLDGSSTSQSGRSTVISVRFPIDGVPRHALDIHRLMSAVRMSTVKNTCH